ncbi:hypothetical protein T03_335 [Trichinella britovi]|uniref:Uncharacterized protein n=1 Tax=Trichinella britovi TaxID=45882 RepID=A0A0V1DHP0_TRIBR|nr:hypothetical protein T03_335 [Trichinella britovi]
MDEIGQFLQRIVEKKNPSNLPTFTDDHFMFESKQWSCPTIFLVWSIQSWSKLRQDSMIMSTRRLERSSLVFSLWTWTSRCCNCFSSSSIRL